MKTVGFIIVAVFIVLAVIAGSIYYISRYHTVDKTGMIREDYFTCEYTEFGGMSGKELRILLMFDSGTPPVIDITERESANAEEEHHSHTVSMEVVYKIQDLYDTYGVDTWGELPEDDVFALDAPITGVSIETPEKTISIDSTRIFPDGGFQFIHDVYDVLMSY